MAFYRPFIEFPDIDNPDLMEKWFLYQESSTLFFSILDKFILKKRFFPVDWITIYLIAGRGIFFYKRHVRICEKARKRLIRRHDDYRMLEKILM